MRKITIYGYEDIKNGKFYIGQTSTSKKVRQKIGYSGCLKFYKIIQKYANTKHISDIAALNKCFRYHVFARIGDKDLANIAEQFYIEKYNSIDNGYNFLPGGKNTYDEINIGKPISSKILLQHFKDELL